MCFLFRADLTKNGYDSQQADFLQQISSAKVLLLEIQYQQVF